MLIKQFQYLATKFVHQYCQQRNKILERLSTLMCHLLAINTALRLIWCGSEAIIFWYTYCYNNTTMVNSASKNIEINGFPILWSNLDE